MKSIAYILSRYPTLSETFVSSEINSLADSGINVLACSLLDNNVIDDKDNRSEIVRLRFNSPDFYLFTFMMFLFHPVLSIKGFGFVLRFFQLDPRFGMKLLALLPKLVFFSLKCKKKGVSHIHSHFSGLPASCAQIVACLTGLDNSFMYHTLGELDSPLMTINIENAKNILANSERNISELKSRYAVLLKGKKVCLVRSGLGLELGYCQQERIEYDYDIICVGRMVYKKGIDVLVDALAMLEKKGRLYKCAIVGDGPELEKIRDKVCGSNIKGVVICGSLSNRETREKTKKSRLFVLPCRTLNKIERVRYNDYEDGLPVAITEAMSYGIPVISTAIGGICEVVINGETGILVKQNEPTELARAIEKVIENNELRTQMGNKAYDLIQKIYDKKVILKTLITDVFGL